MARKTLTQMRLEQAKAVTEEVRGNASLRNEYASVIEEAPMLIRATGLGPAVAFLAGKSRGGERIAQAIADWLLRALPHSPFRSADDGATHNEPNVSHLLDKIGAADPRSYRLAQAEAIEYAAWLKRLSQALIKGPTEAGVGA